jgi:hypothetical protein
MEKDKNAKRIKARKQWGVSDEDTEAMIFHKVR